MWLVLNQQLDFVISLGVQGVTTQISSVYRVSVGSHPSTLLDTAVPQVNGPVAYRKHLYATKS